MIEEHAILAPSSAPQWGNCSGSVMASRHAPDLDSEESRRGTAAHWVGSETLESHKRGEPRHCWDLVGKVAPNGVVIDEEMAEGADVYVSDVLAVAEEYGMVSEMMIEKRVAMPQIHAQNWGTLDCALAILRQRVIYLWDYKNGHREVLSRFNLQFIDYMAGLVNELGINGQQDQHIRVVMRAVQPFCYKAKGPVDEWSCMLSDLRGHFNQLASKAHEALTSPSLSTGPWCRDCHAVKTCSAARRASYNLIDYASAPYEMDAMTGPDLAVERQILAAGSLVAKAS